MTDNNIYRQHGYDNRQAYLRGLAEEHGISYQEVYEIAAMLGPNEDFDGLVTELEDYELLYSEE